MEKDFLEDCKELQVSPRKRLLDQIGEWFDGKRGYDTLEEHDSTDAIELKDDAAIILANVREYLKNLDG